VLRLRSLPAEAGERVDPDDYLIKVQKSIGPASGRDTRHVGGGVACTLSCFRRSCLYDCFEFLVFSCYDEYLSANGACGYGLSNLALLRGQDLHRDTS
jgi:hypothetical protein